MNRNIKAGVVLLCIAAALGIMWLAGRSDPTSDTAQLAGGLAAISGVIGFLAIAEGVVRGNR